MNIAQKMLVALSSSLLCWNVNAAQPNQQSWNIKKYNHLLTGWAALPAEARTPGPTSGQFIEGVKGIETPFQNSQVIPGWSALLNNHDGTFLAMPDNGFGSKANSSDYVLGYYNVRPTFKRFGNGTTQPGPVTNNFFVALNDAHGFLNDNIGVDLTIVADFNNYPTLDGNAVVESGIPVAEEIHRDRLLTGFDFDIESAARTADGALWIGEEFGPYLLKFDEQTGTLLQDPIPHPSLRSPFNPEVLDGTENATLGSSRGFESLAANADGTMLYAVPEAAPLIDELRPVPGDERVLEIFEFDPVTNQYTGRTFKYEKDGNPTGNNIVIGDMTNLGSDRYVLIERDSGSGVNAVVKRLYVIELSKTDDRGILKKRLLVDLLDINDPLDIGGALPNIGKKRFNLPFDSIENVVLLNSHTLGVAIDTNYPFEDGRTCTTPETCGWAYPEGTPDDTEFVTISFKKSLLKKDCYGWFCR
ncbi:hypothetical protein TDB9533_01425 [Thalassocella blandensis]|nr:hypothetical protein TDB9533_01425 [Thalassocella blandensis]